MTKPRTVTDTDAVEEAVAAVRFFLASHPTPTVLSDALRTVLSELDRLRAFGGLLVAGYMDGTERELDEPPFTAEDGPSFFAELSKLPDFAEARQTINAARLRSAPPLFTEADAEALRPIVAFYESGDCGPGFDREIATLESLATRISDHIAGQKEGKP